MSYATINAKLIAALAALDGLVVVPPPDQLPLPMISNVTAIPASLPAGGGPVVIDATVTDATKVTVGGLEVTLPTLPITVTASRTFQIAAEGPGGTATASVSVAVAMPPPVDPPPDPLPVGALKITALPVPDDFYKPYRTKGSKHTNAAFCSIDGLIWESGGDWEHSATDGTHTINPKTGEQIRVIGYPIPGTLPAPHALQDGAGIFWVDAKKQFLIVPGAYMPYFPKAATDAGLQWPRDHDAMIVHNPKIIYSCGSWWLDPVAKAYTQELRLFGTPGTGTGCLHGGVFDEVRNEVVAFTEQPYGINRWSLDTFAKTWQAFTPPMVIPSKWAATFKRGRYEKIGRYVYFVGWIHDGTMVNRKPKFWRVHLDTSALEELAPPPIDVRAASDMELRIAASNGTLIFPFTPGAGLDIQLFTYAADKWSEHVERPIGNFIGNALASDGKQVMFAGGMSKPQTHIYIIEA